MGAEGLQALAPGSDAMVIIDVFSFTTAVDVVVSHGGRVYPYRWMEEGAVEFAQRVGAVAAMASRRDPNGYSLSPVSLMRLPTGTSIVLPSPNGSTLSLMTGEIPTFAGCIRNARAVAKAAERLGRRVGVIPGGERWKDGSLRPAIEDLIGAGAVIHFLTGSKSPEAELAEAAFMRFEDHLESVLAACGSGKEAADRGSVEDVRLTAALNTSRLAPRLVDGAYQAAPEKK